MTAVLSTVSARQNMKDYLGLQLQDMPYFRGLLRAVEAREYHNFDLPHPQLDLGCGDGHFVTIALDEKVDVGIDPWEAPIRQAVQRGGYHLVIRGDGDSIPVADGFFASAMSNSVLEHIPDVEAVLAETARVLRPGAPFVFCVPNHHFVENLSIARFLDRLGIKGLASTYRRFFNRISRHHHCDPPNVWEARLKKAGFEIEQWWHYFSPQATSALEWGHYFGLPSLVSKALFGRWILIRAPWNLRLTRGLLQRYYDEPRQQPNGSYTFYITRRTSS